MDLCPTTTCLFRPLFLLLCLPVLFSPLPPPPLIILPSDM